MDREASNLKFESANTYYHAAHVYRLKPQKLQASPEGRKPMALQGVRRISLRIVQDPTINSGRPIIEGTRVFVDRLIGHLENGMSTSEICEEYDLTQEQVLAVKQLSLEQVQYVKGYADALENVAVR
jgi:uncharacterized protein (DUF433 family)